MNPQLAALVAEAKRKHAAKLAEQGNSNAAHTGNKETSSAEGFRITAPEKGAPNVTVSRVLTANRNFQPTIPGLDLNDKQTLAVELAMRGKSICLIGAAGTGKTTTTREIIGQLVRLSHISPIQSSTKYLLRESPGIVVISFTNKAVNNLKKFLPEELKQHCMTYHKLLQYEPKQYDLEPGNPASKKTMRFEPTFTSSNPLPHISCIIVEESSMVAEELHKVLLNALPNPQATQFIFLGDLNQLPPIFGPSILGFKLNELPVVELDHVYRQALESPIITLAHKIREGKGFVDGFKKDLTVDGFIDDRGEHGKVTLYPWKKKIQSVSACKTAQNFIINLIKAGKYDLDQDIILCPFNKSFGTIELNRAIADYLGKSRNAEVFEVIARGSKSYWAVGDRVLVDRREANIIRIEPTPGYSGPIPQMASVSLDRWGNDPNSTDLPEDADNAVKLANFDILDTLAGSVADGEEQKNSASHTITVEFVDSGTTQSLSSAGDVNSMLFAYVLTVHKSQGSEWRRVFILLHYSHNTMLSRELLYTAVTRAKHELFVICEPDRGEVYNSITRAAKSPEISGVTLAEKALYFQAKKKSMQRLAEKNLQQEFEEEG